MLPDFKKQWPQILYHCILAILAVIFGYNQYQQGQSLEIHQQQIEQITNFTCEDQEEETVNVL